jgi:hypothetical protein
MIQLNGFQEKLKEIFDKIPIKTKFLKDLGFNNSYSGFRYFMQDRKESPSKKLMDDLCQRMGYEYVMIPVKMNEDTIKKKEELENQFFTDLEEYLKQYEGDPTRVYVKHFGNESTVASAIEAFSLDEAIDEDKKIDVSDLF